MRLSLSSAAAADWTLPELLEACERRGLTGLELVAGHRHGVTAEVGAVHLVSIGELLDAAGVGIVAYRVEELGAVADSKLAWLSGTLGAPVVVSRSALGALGDGFAELRAWALRAADLFDRWGGELLLEHGSDASHARSFRSLVESEGTGVLGLAWDAIPSDPRFGSESSAVLASAGSALRHIRLRGGGPESAGQEGQGIGALMARLTLGGYRGALAITPSTDRYRVAWGAWLGRRGWGCGSKGSDDSLVVLDPVTLQREH